MRLSLFLFAIVLFFSNKLIAADTSIYEQESVPANNFHIYVIAASIDDWPGWKTFSTYAQDEGVPNFATDSIYCPAANEDQFPPSFLATLQDFREVLKTAYKYGNFEGDIRGDNAYISLNALPETYDGSGNVFAEKQLLANKLQCVFGWKQDNKGRCYIASPIEPEIKEENDYSSIEKIDVDHAIKSIYSNLQSVSSKFLNNGAYLPRSARKIFKELQENYHNREECQLDITEFSARSRISLLKSIINFKLEAIEDPDCWEEVERKTANNVVYTERVDSIPTTFKIGRYKYKLENAFTKKKPGGGRIYGLLDQRIAETYSAIYDHLLSLPLLDLPQYKAALLKQKRDGKPINIGSEEVNCFFNGLNLLFDFEVARRLESRDVYRNLPVITSVSVLLKKFDDLGFVKKCFDKLFTGDLRATFVRKHIIPIQHNIKTKKQIREQLIIFHKDNEDSDSDD